MKHTDVKDGGEYAKSVGYGRPTHGDNTNLRVRVKDRAKDYVRVRVTTEDAQGRATSALVTMRHDDERARGRYGLDRFMSLETLDAETGQVTGETVAQPRDLTGTWAEHLVALERLQAARQRIAEQRDEAKARRDAVSAALAAAGVEATSTTYPRSGWVLDEGQATPLRGAAGRPARPG